jgi:uncharacterized protein YgbK (DUF1537 family)
MPEKLYSILKPGDTVTLKTLGIVADDLTGAMDSSGYFASCGFNTLVVLDVGFPAKTELVVVNTNSRSDNGRVASEKVRLAIKSLAGRFVYKKCDSTLRGNVAVELAVAFEELHSEKAIVAPAFPALGRTTVGGNLLVDGVSVTKTQFADDPVSPVKEANIPRLLQQSTKHKIGCIPIELIHSGAEGVYRQISKMSEEIIVCDVTEQFHLSCIAKAAFLAEDRWLLCGSGGLARELHIFLPLRGTGRMASSNIPPGPVLIVVGTRNSLTAKQLLKAREELGVTILNLDSEQLVNDETCSSAMRELVSESIELLRQGKSVILSSTFSRYVPALKQLMSGIMAELVANILLGQKVAGLFLSGGDTAVEICRALSVVAIQVRGEVEPGIPAGELVGGKYEGMRVVTKAGGFGTEVTIVKSISYLEKGKLE